MSHVQTRFTLEELQELDKLNWIPARSLVPYTDKIFTALGVEGTLTSEYVYYRCGERLCKHTKFPIPNETSLYQFTHMELGDFFLHDWVNMPHSISSGVN